MELSRNTLKGGEGACSEEDMRGAAAEATGLDKSLKVNTVKHRTHSLFNQGVYFYGALPMMKEAKFQMLITKYDELLDGIRFFREAYGLV